MLRGITKCHAPLLNGRIIKFQTLFLERIAKYIVYHVYRLPQVWVHVVIPTIVKEEAPGRNHRNIWKSNCLTLKGWSQNRVKIFYPNNVKIALLTPSLPSIFTDQFTYELLYLQALPLVKIENFHPVLTRFLSSLDYPSINTLSKWVSLLRMEISCRFCCDWFSILE